MPSEIHGIIVKIIASDSAMLEILLKLFIFRTPYFSIYNPKTAEFPIMKCPLSSRQTKKQKNQYERFPLLHSRGDFSCGGAVKFHGRHRAKSFLVAASVVEMDVVFNC